MALISCPECGHPISEKASKCPSCGHCMNSVIETASFENSNLLADSKPSVISSVKTHPFSKSFLNKRTLLCSLIVLLLACSLFVISHLSPKKIEVESISIQKWFVTESTSYSDHYEGHIVSDQTKPFVAVIGGYGSKTISPSFVYVENGAGVFETSVSDDDDPSLIYRPIGYLAGTPVSDTEISVNYTDHDYSDWSYSKSTDCTVDIDIDLKNSQSGILIFDLVNETNNETSKNHTANVVDGSAKFHYFAELPYKTRGIELKIIPRLFCKCQPISDNDYTIVSPYETEYEKGTYTQSYSGKMSLRFNNISDGFILYTKKLTDGGMNRNRNISQNLRALLDNGDCTLTTYDYADSDQSLSTPSYEFNIIGHLYWTSL